MAEFDYEEVVKATDNFNPTRLIGKGSHGWVYKGVLFQDNNKLVIAVKKPSQSLHQEDNSKLENEIQGLSSLRESPHVLKLVGSTTSHRHRHHDHDDDEYSSFKLIVMEFMPNGSLHEWLHASKTPPTWLKRFEIAMQIARALKFLHQGKPLVIHRDIKSSNILIDSQWNAKLADFGLAIVIDRIDEPVVPSQPAGTIGYLDPSYTTPSKLSTKNDMFSFGVVLLEIMSGRKAIDVCKTPASIVEWAIPLIEDKLFDEICDKRIALPPAAYMVNNITHLLREAARCVSPNEDDRPSAEEVIMGMEKNRLVERVRFPIWTSFLKSMVRLRKKRRKLVMMSTVTTKQEGEVEVDSDHKYNHMSITIKEVLAHVS
ncbi:serine/threonine-protein kinase-like protein At5g23170 [Gastrolobium bilobum]|uniref:serine/threonine-protein kinase-like protein At5g23170 n=1 Tax=Gastrolobium bilobum TaxID=150636 RepID=UPI002AB13744|nr:serine/threonine-protein kinase-like protein At5g23170 [Gastrolobium bilobum]